MYFSNMVYILGTSSTPSTTKSRTRITRKVLVYNVVIIYLVLRRRASILALNCKCLNIWLWQLILITKMLSCMQLNLSQLHFRVWLPLLWRVFDITSCDDSPIMMCIRYTKKCKSYDTVWQQWIWNINVNTFNNDIYFTWICWMNVIYSWSSKI